MFNNVRNKMVWEARIAQPSTNSYMAKVIREVFLPYKINAKQFDINCFCIENCCKQTPSGERASQSVIETVSDLSYKFSCIRCSSMPYWYYYAFPDVFLWTISDAGGKVCNEKIFPKLEGVEMLDYTDCVKPEIVLMFIKQYIRSTGKKLELSI